MNAVSCVMPQAAAAVSLSTEHSLDVHDVFNRKRSDQGRHECEVLGPGPEAAESMYQWGRCTKNPGHMTFIPAPEFCLKHLPSWCRKNFLLDIVTSSLDLTVRLRVSYTSRDRPCGYSFYTCRGSDVLHTGTGFVWEVVDGEGPCRCPDCVRSSAPRQKWYQIFIDTACHVVFNTEEARQTKVDFFYDDEASRADGRMKSLWASEVVTKDEQGDCCILLCATHDEALVERLWDSLFRTKRLPVTERLGRLPSDLWRLCVVVSHPHGQPKQVTVGQGQRKSGQTYVYIADTCPGSSGAPVLVFVPDNERLRVSDNGALLFVAPHSQCVIDEGLNLSGWGRCLSSPYRSYCQRMRWTGGNKNVWWHILPKSVRFPHTT